MATTTRAAERALTRTQYNAFLAVCPSRQLLDRISDKWVVLVLCALGDDTPLQPPQPHWSVPDFVDSKLSRKLV